MIALGASLNYISAEEGALRDKVPEGGDLLPLFPRAQDCARGSRQARWLRNWILRVYVRLAWLLHARTEALGGKHAESRADHGAKQT